MNRKTRKNNNLLTYKNKRKYNQYDRIVKIKSKTKFKMKSKKLNPTSNKAKAI